MEARVTSDRSLLEITSFFCHRRGEVRLVFGFDIDLPPKVDFTDIDNRFLTLSRGSKVAREYPSEGIRANPRKRRQVYETVSITYASENI